MNNEQIIEGNSLIADYMEAMDGKWKEINIIDYPTGQKEPFRLYYNKDWNLIVPVVQKVLNEKNKNADVSFISSQHSIKSALIRLDIDYLFFEIVKFIKLHNDIQSKN
jgi:hypothetical protein